MKRMLLAVLVLVATLCWPHRPAPVQAVSIPARVMTPPGTYYILSYYATATPTGVIGWTPGEKVSTDKQRMASGGFIAITDGTYSADVPGVILTRDVETAEALLLADQASQDHMHVINAVIREADKSRDLLAAKATARSIEHTNALLVAASTIGAFRNRLNLPAYPASGGAGGGYYNDTDLPPAGPYSLADNVTGTASLDSGDTSSTITQAIDLTGRSGDLTGVVANAHREALRDRGLGIPPALMNRFATDAFHLDYFRDNP